MEQFGSYGLAAYGLGTISPSSTLDLIELCPLVVRPGLCRLLVLLKLCELIGLPALAVLSGLSAISAPSLPSASGLLPAPFSCTALKVSACLNASAMALRFSPLLSRASIRTRNNFSSDMMRIALDVRAAVRLVALFVDGRPSCHSREGRFAVCHHVVAVGPSPSETSVGTAQL